MSNEPVKALVISALITVVLIIIFVVIDGTVVSLQHLEVGQQIADRYYENQFKRMSK